MTIFNCISGIVGLDCQATDIHQIKYHDDDLLKDTIELCPSCHIKKLYNYISMHMERVGKLSRT